MIRSDNGSNFIGAENELCNAFNEMDHTKISNFLLGNGTDWLVLIKNTPTASHMVESGSDECVQQETFCPPC